MGRRGRRLHSSRAWRRHRQGRIVGLHARLACPAQDPEALVPGRDFSADRVGQDSEIQAARTLGEGRGAGIVTRSAPPHHIRGYLRTPRPPSQTQHHARVSRGRSGYSTKLSEAARLRPNQKAEEAMSIDRRQLILPALAFGLLGVAGVSVVPALAASADEEAVAKNVEAFRAAQAVGNAEALAGLCAAELSYSHSSGAVDDKASLLAGVTNAKNK